MYLSLNVIYSDYLNYNLCALVIHNFFFFQPFSIHGWTLAFLFAVHRLCGVIEGRLNHFLPRWLRTGWQSMIIHNYRYFIKYIIYILVTFQFIKDTCVAM